MSEYYVTFLPRASYSGSKYWLQIKRKPWSGWNQDMHLHSYSSSLSCDGIWMGSIMIELWNFDCLCSPLKALLGRHWICTDWLVKQARALSCKTVGHCAASWSHYCHSSYLLSLLDNLRDLMVAVRSPAGQKHWPLKFHQNHHSLQASTSSNC